jgi:LAO/AO transport system kinase
MNDSVRVGALHWRRNLSRALTRENRASVRQILSDGARASGSAQRIGVTGPPGAGKSSLIASLAKYRLQFNRTIGVLAIDPTSPISNGSLLGDRIRMDAVADDLRLFIRSVASGSLHDGLCQNAIGMLDTMDTAGFDDIILETVGVGQVSYDARTLVDSLVLVLVPESGDTVQAMKAGILEMADVYVVNKADLPNADRLNAELQSVIRRGNSTTTSMPAIINISTKGSTGIADLSKAIDSHYASHRRTAKQSTGQFRRRHYQIRSLLSQHLEELISSKQISGDMDNLRQTYAQMLKLMQGSAE